PQATASQAKTFNVGAVVNASGTGTCGTTCISGVFGWQFSIIYDNTSFVPQADPTATAADGASPTVQFGAQTTTGNPHWDGLMSTSNAFAGSVINSVDATHKKIQVFYAINAPHAPVNIFPTLSATVKGNLLASISFEIIRIPSSPSSFNITELKM